MIQPDKLKHVVAGIIVAAYLLILWAVEQLLAPGLIAAYPWAFAAFNGASAAHLTKEAADWLDNTVIPYMHSVDPLDFAAGQLGSTLTIIAMVALLHLASL